MRWPRRARADDALPLSPLKPVAEDVQRELAAHLELRSEELIAQGWTPEAARAEAQKAFGDVPRVAEECREITSRHRRARRRAEFWESLWQDLAYAARVLRKNPGFTLGAIGTLALGIGANTAIFSAVNGLLLRPLPYDHPDRIVDISESHLKGSANPPWPNFVDWRAQSRSFDAMAAYGGGLETVLGLDEPARVQSAEVSEDFFKALGARPVMGRLPLPEEHRLGAAPVAVVSWRFWLGKMGAPHDLSTRRLRTDADVEVVGVLPPGFSFPNETDVWTPIELHGQSTSRTAHNWNVVGRLKAGISPDAADRELDAITARLRPLYLPDFDATGTDVRPLQDVLTVSIRRPLFIMLGASALLLLAACANLASTMLARGTARGTELAVRASLGAGRGRLVRQLFTESVLLASLGCAAGLALGMALLRALVALAPAALTMPGAIGLDASVLGFTVFVALLTSTLFGLVPALRATANATAGTLREGRSSGPRRQRLWSALVAIEVALALVLLVGSGLLIRSFASVLGVDLGFQPAGVLTISTELPRREYPDVARAVSYHDRALEELRALPGVTSVGVTNMLPLQGEFPSGGVQVEGRPLLPVGYPITGYAVYRLASVGFFDAMGIRLLRGRVFAESDGAGAPPVMVINEAMAKEGWPGDDPIGKRMRIGGMDGPGAEPWATIIGVVHDVPGGSVTSPPKPAYYYSYRQLSYRSRRMTTVIRTSVPPAMLTGQVRTLLHRLDSDVPLSFRTMEERVAGAVADRRFIVLVLGAFAAVAFVLAAVGIYGVVSYSVAQRTREIGIRIALGAVPASVRRMVQARALMMIGAGIGVGVLGALAITRVMRSLLYDVTPTDPVTFGGVILLLAGAGWIASRIPAGRATKVDPMLAIRAE